MDTKKHIVDLESFGEMLHISPRVSGQSFAELPFEEEILEFLRFLGHSAQIKTLTDVKVEHKNQKKSNEMYYPRFTKVIIHHFMTKKPSIPRRNRVNWHYVRDDILLSTIKVVSRHQNTQQYGAILPIELTTEDIRNTKAYKEYYACAIGEAAPKPKASARKKKETREQEEESFDPIPQTPEDSEDDDHNEEDQGLRIGEEEMMHEEEEAYELYRDVDINQGRGLQVSQETEDSHVILTPTHSDGQQESSSTSSFMTNLLNPTIDPGMVSIFTIGSSTVTPIPLPQSTMIPSIISTFTTASQLPTPPTPIPILDLQNLPTFASRRREDDDQEGPSARSDRGSKRQRERGEHASANTPSEPATGSAGRSTTGTQSRQLSASESAFAEEPMQTTCQMEEPSHLPRKPPTPDRDWNKSLPAAQGDAQSWISVLAKQTNARSSFNELLDTPIDFSNFIMNRLGVDILTHELLAGPTYELIRGSCNSLTELEYHLEEVYKETTD
nr:hypothetical protein [Tanacetum cinerariifolium]